MPGSEGDVMTGKAATGTAQIRPPEQDYAPAVSSHEDPLSVADGFGGADGDVEREWPWVDVLPECDRRLFAEEMSQLMAEAAETDDLATRRAGTAGVAGYGGDLLGSRTPEAAADRAPRWRTAGEYQDPSSRPNAVSARSRRSAAATRRVGRPLRGQCVRKGMGAGLPRLALKRAGGVGAVSGGLLVSANPHYARADVSSLGAERNVAVVRSPGQVRVGSDAVEQLSLVGVRWLALYLIQSLVSHSCEFAP